MGTTNISIVIISFIVWHFRQSNNCQCVFSSLLLFLFVCTGWWWLLLRVCYKLTLLCVYKSKNEGLRGVLSKNKRKHCKMKNKLTKTEFTSVFGIYMFFSLIFLVQLRALYKHVCGEVQVKRKTRKRRWKKNKTGEVQSNTVPNKNV